MASCSWFQSQGCVTRTYIPCRLGDEAWRISAYDLQTSVISHHNILLNDVTTEKHGWSVDPPPSPHPQQTVKPTTKNKNSKKANNNTHNINNHNKQTTQQNNKSQQKRIIRTNKQKQKKSPPRSTYSTVLCFVLYVDGSPLFILWFSFCSFLFNLLLWWDKPNVDWMVKRQAMLVGTRQKLTSASVNSCQLDDSTVPLWPSTPFSMTIAQSHSDRQQPSAWR